MDTKDLEKLLETLYEIDEASLYEQYSPIGLTMLSTEDLEAILEHGEQVDEGFKVPDEIHQRFHANIERVIKCLNAVGGKAGIKERRMSHLRDLPLSGIGSNEMHSICESIEKEYNLPETPGASEQIEKSQQ